MAAIKSFSNSAKKAGWATSRAFRKLFGRPAPVGNGSSDGTNTNTSDSGRRRREEGDAAATDSRVTSSNKDHEAVSSRSPSASTSPTSPVQSAATPTPRVTDTETTANSITMNGNTVNGDYNPRMSHPTLGQVQGQEQLKHVDKENQPPVGAVDIHVDSLVAATRKLGLGEPNREADFRDDVSLRSSEEPQTLTAEERAYQQGRERHLDFIHEALDMARLALKINETPVGCVLVHDDKVIAKGMNATNVTRNGTRHAEFMALSALLSQQPVQGTKTTSLKPKLDPNLYEEVAEDGTLTCSPQPDAGNEDGSKGHLYPYGQKIHPDTNVDRKILTESILYVTVEPCIMCASLLRQLGIKKVFFGAVNDKFGGTGGVFSIHANSLPVGDGDQAASAHPQSPPIRLPDGGKVLGTSFPPGGGDGGNVERGYEIEGGWGRDEAVGLLRRFYVQENGRAPIPRKKEGRAARLAAIMDGTDDASVYSGSAEVGGMPNGDDLGLGAGSMDDVPVQELREVQ